MPFYSPKACASYCCGCRFWRDGCLLRWRCGTAQFLRVEVLQSETVISDTIQQTAEAAGSILLLDHGTYRIYTKSTAEGAWLLAREMTITEEEIENCCGSSEYPGCSYLFGVGPGQDVSQYTLTLAGEAEFDGTYVLDRYSADWPDTWPSFLLQTPWDAPYGQLNIWLVATNQCELRLWMNWNSLVWVQTRDCRPSSNGFFEDCALRFPCVLTEQMLPAHLRAYNGGAGGPGVPVEVTIAPILP